MESARAETVFMQHYDRLTRIAYLVAPPLPGRQSRLVRAHRLVHRALPWRARTELTYPEMVARVLRRAARARRVGLPVLVDWAWHTPVAGGPDHRRLDAALADADPSVRAGYVLTMVEQLPARDAVVMLQKAGWADAVTRLAAATALRQRIHDEYGLRPDRQRELLAAPPADPTLIRLRAPDPLMIRLRRRVRAGAVVLVTLLAAALVAGLLLLRPDEAPLQVRRVAPAAWVKASELTLASWPTRGGRADDDGLLRAALTAWHEGGPAVRVTTEAGAATDPPISGPHLLFAGDVEGAGAVAVLADAGRIATYRESGEDRTLRIQPVPRPDPYTASAIRLGAGRYLLAPWVSGAESGGLGGGWQPLSATDGVTAPVTGASGGACWDGPLLRLRSAEVGAARPYVLADLGTATLAHLMYIPPEPAVPMTRPSELDGSAAPTWAELGCVAGEVRDRAAESVTVWELWRGRLPAGSHSARVACVRAALPGAGSRVWAVAMPDGEPAEVVATGTGNRLCSRLSRDVVIGWWWQAPSGDWFHLASGSRRVREIEVTVAGERRRGARQVISGPYREKPDGPAEIHAPGVPVLP